MASLKFEFSYKKQLNCGWLSSGKNSCWSDDNDTGEVNDYVNPNKKFAMPFTNGFDFNVSYGRDVLSSGSIEPFELKKKESNLVKTTINTLSATLSEEAAKRMEDELRTSKVVNFHI
ncbi:hypothetical protein LWI29_032602 [Acer saccharum]|uniref:Uncharacterized protein n=1 Tax=Acer saccharum TaxID=4024 RepID=A0AA39W0K4_ACESA|nr:hypothetical protein LWI29_032602 [Acer saccharum]